MHVETSTGLHDTSILIIKMIQNTWRSLGSGVQTRIRRKKVREEPEPGKKKNKLVY
jgi:hypothetical protein